MSAAAASRAEYRTLAETMGVEENRVEKLAEVAWRLFDGRKYREAASVFRGLTVLDPENVDLYRGQALAAAQDNDLLAATDALERGIGLLAFRDDRNSDRGQLLALYASLLYRSGRRRESVAAARASIAISPPGAAWLEGLQKGLKRAKAVITKTAAPAPEAAALRQVLKSRLIEVGRGTATLARALGYGDKDLMGVYKNGAALVEAGQPERASRILEGLVELDGGIPLFHLALGRAREVAGDHKAAATAYTKAVRTAREIEGALDILGDALLRRARHAFKRGKRRAVKKDMKEGLRLEARAVGDEMRKKMAKLMKAAGGDPNKYGYRSRSETKSSTVTDPHNTLKSNDNSSRRKRTKRKKKKRSNEEKLGAKRR